MNASPSSYLIAHRHVQALQRSLFQESTRLLCSYVERLEPGITVACHWCALHVPSEHYSLHINSQCRFSCSACHTELSPLLQIFHVHTCDATPCRQRCTSVYCPYCHCAKVHQHCLASGENAAELCQTCREFDAFTQSIPILQPIVSIGDAASEGAPSPVASSISHQLVPTALATPTVSVSVPSSATPLPECDALTQSIPILPPLMLNTASGAMASNLSRPALQPLTELALSELVLIPVIDNTRLYSADDLFTWLAHEDQGIEVNERALYYWMIHAHEFGDHELMRVYGSLDIRLPHGHNTFHISFLCETLTFLMSHGYEVPDDEPHYYGCVRYKHAGRVTPEVFKDAMNTYIFNNTPMYASLPKRDTWEYCRPEPELERISSAHSSATMSSLASATPLSRRLYTTTDNNSDDEDHGSYDEEHPSDSDYNDAVETPRSKGKHAAKYVRSVISAAKPRSGKRLRLDLASASRSRASSSTSSSLKHTSSGNRYVADIEVDAEEERPPRQFSWNLSLPLPPTPAPLIRATQYNLAHNPAAQSPLILSPDGTRLEYQRVSSCRSSSSSA